MATKTKKKNGKGYSPTARRASKRMWQLDAALHTFARAAFDAGAARNAPHYARTLTRWARTEDALRRLMGIDHLLTTEEDKG